MKFKLLLPIISLLIFLGGCSASYKQLSKMENKKPKNFQEHLLSEYKKRASFEAEEMHDWNSAKLYSEKALKSLETDEIYPEEISYWKIPEERIAQKLKEKCSVEFGHSLNIDGKTLKVCRVSQLHYKRIEHKLTDREKSNY